MNHLLGFLPTLSGSAYHVEIIAEFWSTKKFCDEMACNITPNIILVWRWKLDFSLPKSVHQVVHFYLIIITIYFCPVSSNHYKDMLAMHWHLSSRCFIKWLHGQYIILVSRDGSSVYGFLHQTLQHMSPQASVCTYFKKIVDDAHK